MMDIEDLRQALMDYYGTARGNYPMAVLEVSRIETATAEELIAEAKRLGWI